MVRVLHGSILAGAVLLAGCASTPSAPQAATGEIDESALNALYAQLDKDSQRFEAGIAFARGGDTQRAQAEIGAALDDVRAAAARCGAMPGCDEQRFFAAFDRMLRLKVDGLAGTLAEGELEATPDADVERDESSPVVATLPQLGRSVTLLKGRELGDIIALNGPVKVALEKWLGQYRPNLIDAYENYEYLRSGMWPEYRKAGLPEALLFGMLAKESGGKVHAVSRSGASGPLQFMYATGLRFGLRTVDGFDQRFDPTLATRANAEYINEQLAIFNDNLELVLGAYNGGEGRMRRLVKAASASSFWDPSIYFESSAETRDYVPMVLAAAYLFLHPERYRLEFPKIDGRPGSITLAAPASITELSVCLGQDGDPRSGWFRTLRNLNPQLEPNDRAPAGTRLAVPKSLESAYATHCAQGPWQQLAANLHDASVPVAPRSLTRSYVVRKGDTLSSIARRNGCGSAAEIARKNGVKAPRYMIRPGQRLTLTGCSAR
jgi:membrane-bound lytic murein transglycosylase D